MSLLTRIANVFRRDRLLENLDDELAFHVSERIDELEAEGMSPEAARAEALRRFGNYSRQRERTRDMNVEAWLEALVADLKYGARQMRLNPGFTAVAVLSLALGIGANAAIFQLINAIRLRSLPGVEAPSRLTAIVHDGEFESSGWYDSRHDAFTYAQYDELRRNQDVFSGLLAFGSARFNVARGGEVRYADGLWVSSNALEVLGVVPVIGRGFAVKADERDCSQVGAVLGHAFWQREYGGAVDAIGREIHLRGRTFPILGVTPPEFVGLEPGRRFDVLLPLCAESLLVEEPRQRRMERSDAWWLTLIGRLDEGWTVARANARIREHAPALFRATVPEAYRPADAERYQRNQVRVEPASAGLSALRRRYEDPLWILQIVAGLVLLIACSNLANLLLARASARQRDMAVRQAMGGTRGRLVAQLTIESLLLAVLGTAAGLVIAQVASRALVRLLSTDSNPIVLALSPDANVLAFAAFLAIATCLLFGVGPAFRATSAAPAVAMQGGRGTAQSAERQHLRRALVVIQVAISLVLLCGALLFAQTLRTLLAADTGMSPEGVLVASIDAGPARLSGDRRKVAFDEMHSRIAALPGVESVSESFISPFSGAGWNGNVYASDASGDAARTLGWFNLVGPDYFATLRTPLLAGRDFGPQDSRSAPRVAIVNEEFARRVFGGGNPIGRAFRVQGTANENDEEYQVIGLVRNTKYNALREEYRPIAFRPLSQEEELSDAMSYLIRSRTPLSTTMRGIGDAMATVDPALLVDFRVLEVQIAQSVLRERLMAQVSGAFGILATLLAATGLYGVMSYMVTRRSRELALRLALGADGRHVLGLVFSEAGRLVGLGVVVGAVGAYFAARHVRALLYGLEFHDAPTMVVGCVLLLITGLLAAAVPAGRALRSDPADALRGE